MKTGKTTKRALVSSALAIVMCAAMLIGTTFAWFTDTASTSVNKIQAGNLKISLLDSEGNDLTQDGEKLQWKVRNEGNKKGEDGKLYHLESDVLWEPGCTFRSEYFYIKNEGNLALKYKLNISFTGDTKLLEALEFSGALVADALGTKTFNSLEELNSYEGHLLPEEGADQARFNINVHMKEEAGNEYQGLNLGDMNITVVATQYTFENDSFGNTYDENAQYPVSSSEELSEALDNIGEGETLVIAPGEFALPDTTVLPEGASISGAGVDKTNLTAPATSSGSGKNTGLVVNTPDVTISNVTIKGNQDITSDMYCGVLDIREGGTTMENVKIVNRSSLSSGVVINRGVDADEKVTMKNLTLDVYHRALFVADAANGTIEVSDSDITGTIYALNVNSSSSQNLVLKFTNSKLHGWSSYGKIKSASFENVEFSKGASEYDYLRPYADTTLTNCTFDEEFLMGAGTTGFTITLQNCAKNGVAVTADNVKTLLLDADDRANLSGCTISVNGVTVTW